ncbi:MAG: glycosyltransferase [Cyanobacteria bacterium J06631_9]
MDSTSARLSIFFQLDPFNPTIGGIQTCIKYILKYAPSAIRVQLIGITQSHAKVGQWQTAELHGREFDFLPLLYVADDNIRGIVPTTVKYALALRKYLQRHRIDSEFYQFHRIEPTVFTRGLSGTKLLYIHNDIYQEIKGGNKGGILWKRFPWAYFALERRLVSQFDRILSCNSQSAQLYREQYPAIAERVSYLPNTYDSELFYPLSPAEKQQAKGQLAQALNLPEDTRFILFAGRLHPQKQPELLIQSLAQLNQSDTVSQNHLIIVGKGELEEDVRREMERLNVSSQVTFIGSLPQHELAELYRTCDLFVLTSAYEGLARSSLEALACGTPVVTTRAGETPNFLEKDSGLVCADHRPETIASDWQQVLTHPEAFPSEACQRVARPYEASHVVQSLYGELLANWQQQQVEASPHSEPQKILQPS